MHEIAMIVTNWPEAAVEIVETIAGAAVLIALFVWGV
jgi:hypothetical protein